VDCRESLVVAIIPTPQLVDFLCPCYRIINIAPTLVVTSCCPDIMGVGLASAAAAAASDCFAKGIGGGGKGG